MLTELVVKIAVDSGDMKRNLKSAGQSVVKFGDLIKANLASRAIEAGVKSTVNAVKTIGKEALNSYANYEQLVGGVETLFGAGGKSLVEYVNSVGKYSPEISAQYNDLMAAQNKVMADADEAYKTAGLSANGYMETVTSFAAALNSSLGGNTQKSAEYANMAVVDMADNANKMGTSMESIQNAYQGFAKQNYTMLDNLKLGYGGTKTEMERLLADASKISGKKFDLSSYADVVEAIHTIQDEMGITGTTAKEAETTISGSVNSMKAAWQNWLTGIGNSDADIGELTENLVQSAQTVVNNVMPVVGQVLTTLGTVVTENAPQILTAGVTLILALIQGIVESIPAIVQAIPQLIDGIVNAFSDASGQILSIGSQIVDDIIDGISSAWDGLVSWFNGLWDSLFGGRSVNVGVTTSGGGGGGRAIGMDYVPYNGMPAVLHRGEAVLTSYEADQWRRGRSGGNGNGITIVQKINATPQTPAQFAATTEAYFQRARWAF